MFYEYFHGDTGAGIGASHQTGWTGAIARIMHIFASSEAQTILDQSKGEFNSREASSGGKAMTKPIYPSLYQVNTRVWLTSLSTTLGRRAQLDDIPDAELDRLAALGFDWVWFLSVWQTGAAAQAISRDDAGWRNEFEETLPDLKDEDVAGSGFAIQDYVVHRDLGGTAALARLRQRLQAAG